MFLCYVLQYVSTIFSCWYIGWQMLDYFFWTDHYLRIFLSEMISYTVLSVVSFGSSK
jgi:hypothetical protein